MRHDLSCNAFRQKQAVYQRRSGARDRRANARLRPRAAPPAASGPHGEHAICGTLWTFSGHRTWPASVATDW